MNKTLTEINHEALNRFIAAWSSKDVDRVLGVAHPEFVYAASVGPEPGSTWRTTEDLRRGLRSMFEYDEGATATVLHTWIDGDTGFMTWRYASARSDGTTDVSLGCDLLRFRGGKLSRKDSYRKVMAKSLNRPDQRTSRDPKFRPPLPRYEPRSFQSHGTWAIGPLTLKVYGITLESDGMSDATRAAARRHVEQRLPEIEGDGSHHELGFVIIHQGMDATWLLMNWWAYGDIRCQLMSSRDRNAAESAAFSPETRALANCVYEEAVIHAETQAWIDAMLSRAPEAGTYLETFMANGLR